MSRLDISLLGSPRVMLDDVPVAVDTRKAIALLARLAVTGTRHSRDTLALLFWPESDSEHARSALRRTLSTLNNALGGRWLEIDREAVAFVPDASARVDVIELRRLLASRATADLRAAVDLYRGDFMAGFSLRDCPDFDDWVIAEAEYLRAGITGALERLVGHACDVSDIELATTYARRWVTLDPLNEPAHRQLMRTLALTGDRSAAIRQYRECERVLNDELGVTPVDATIALFEEIREGHLLPVSVARPIPERASVPTPVSPTVPQATVNHLPLAGRDREMRELTVIWNAIHDTGRVVTIVGEAGIGKTRIASELIAIARELGASVVSCRCYDGESGLAYGPIIDGLRRSLADDSNWLDGLPDHARAALARLVPEHDTDALTSGATVTPLQFVNGIAAALTSAVAGQRPGILLLDDAQWIDDASLDILAYLARRLDGRPMLILITCRSEQMEQGSRLLRLVDDASRDGVGTRIQLDRLSADAVHLLAETTSRGGNDPAFADAILRETEGLPFLIAELLRQAENRDHDGIVWPLTHGGRALLRSRLVGVRDLELQMLSAAAVIGRECDFDTLREASGRSDDEAAEAIDALINRQLLLERPGTDGRSVVYDFSHHKLRELVYGETTLTRRRLLHLRVAHALATRARSQPATGSIAAQIALHYRNGGDHERAAEFHLRAADHARSLFAHTEVVTHLRAALELGTPDRPRALLMLGETHIVRGEYEGALDALREAERAGGPSAVVAYHLGRIAHRMGRWDEATDHYARAAEGHRSGAEPGLRPRTLIEWSLTESRRPVGADRATELSQQALHLAEDLGDNRTLAQAHNLLGMLARANGDHVDAIDHLNRSLALSRAERDDEAQVAALNNLALASADIGDLDHAIALATDALTLCLRLGDRHREAALHNNLADFHHLSCQPDAAMEHLRQSVAIYAEIGVVAGEMEPEIWKLATW